MTQHIPQIPVLVVIEFDDRADPAEMLDILHDEWLDLKFAGCDHAFPACRACLARNRAMADQISHELAFPARPVPVMSPFTRRALAGRLPGKGLSTEPSL